MTGAMWQWMALAMGVGVGVSAYSFLIANAWEEQLRAVRDRQTEEAKRRQERDVLIARIESGNAGNVQAVQPTNVIVGELKPVSNHH